MTQVTCAECKADTTVPFVPEPGRPVYCSPCHKKRRTTGGDRPRGGAGGGRGRFQGHVGPSKRGHGFDRSDYPGHERLAPKAD